MLSVFFCFVFGWTRACDMTCNQYHLLINIFILSVCLPLFSVLLHHLFRLFLKSIIMKIIFFFFCYLPTSSPRMCSCACFCVLLLRKLLIRNSHHSIISYYVYFHFLFLRYYLCDFLFSSPVCLAYEQKSTEMSKNPTSCK